MKYKEIYRWIYYEIVSRMDYERYIKKSASIFGEKYTFTVDLLGELNLG